MRTGGEGKLSFSSLRRGLGIRALRLRYGLDYGGLVQERLRFAINEARNRWLSAGYRLREGGKTVFLRHHPSPHGTPSNDTWILKEIFRDGAYDIPEGVRLPADPRIVDLGANIGLFAALMFSRFPRARITAFEPDGENAALLRASAQRNGYGAALALHEACAMTRSGPVRFAPGAHQFSRIADGEEPSVLRPGIDVFPFLSGADLLKMDIEGGEWELLADERFGEPRHVVLEYHPMLCPSPDPRALARRLLGERGYEIVLDEEPMIWAVKPSRADTGQSGVPQS